MRIWRCVMLAVFVVCGPVAVALGAGLTGAGPASSEPDMHVTSGEMSFGSVVPYTQGEVLSTSAVFEVFSPTGDCRVGVLLRDGVEGLGLVCRERLAQGSVSASEPSDRAPMEVELRWRHPGQPWRQWASPVLASGTPQMARGLWWDVGLQDVPLPCEVELRGRARFELFAPPGVYAPEEPLLVAIWARQPQ